MKFIALEQEIPGVTEDMFTDIFLRKEAAQAWELYQKGIIRELYFRADREEAILVLECKNKKEARIALDTLPLVQSKLIDFEIIPLKAYPGFARLFKKNKK